MQGTNAYITATPHGNYVDRLTSKLICMPIPTPAKLLLPMATLEWLVKIVTGHS